MYKLIPGTTWHECDENGNFRSLDHVSTMKGGYLKDYPGQNLKLSTDGEGYLIINLVRGKRRSYRAHRIVWETFNGMLEAGQRITFKNPDKTNISLSNLVLKGKTKIQSKNAQILKMESEGKSHSEIALKFNLYEPLVAQMCACLRG